MSNGAWLARIEGRMPDDDSWLARFIALCQGLVGEPSLVLRKHVLYTGSHRNAERRTAGLPPEVADEDVAFMARMQAIMVEPDAEQAIIAWLQRLADDHHGVPCDVPGCRYRQGDRQ